jgi:hypothetical protein
MLLLGDKPLYDREDVGGRIRFVRVKEHGFLSLQHLMDETGFQFLPCLRGCVVIRVFTHILL